MQPDQCIKPDQTHPTPNEAKHSFLGGWSAADGVERCGSADNVGQVGSGVYQDTHTGLRDVDSPEQR